MRQRGNINSYKTNVIQLYYYHCAYKRIWINDFNRIKSWDCCLFRIPTNLLEANSYNKHIDWLNTFTIPKIFYTYMENIFGTLKFNADDSFMQAKICKVSLFSPFPSVFYLNDELNQNSFWAKIIIYMLDILCYLYFNLMQYLLR